MLGWHRRMPVSVFLVSNPGLLRLLIFLSHREACLFKGFSAHHINTFFFLLQIISIFCWTLLRKLTFCAIQPVTHSHVLFCPQWFSASCHPPNEHSYYSDLQSHWTINACSPASAEKQKYLPNPFNNQIADHKEGIQILRQYLSLSSEGF